MGKAVESTSPCGLGQALGQASLSEYGSAALGTQRTPTANDMLSNVSSSFGLYAFERMKSKVEELEVNADVSRELSMSGSADVILENNFKTLESDSVQDELQQMKGHISRSDFRVERIVKTVRLHLQGSVRR